MSKNKAKSVVNNGVVTTQNEETTNNKVVNELPKTITEDQIDSDIPEAPVTGIIVMGDRIKGTVTIGERTLQIVLPKPQQRKVLGTIPGIGQVLFVIEKVKGAQGRRVDINSKRQLELAAKAERRAELGAMGIEVKRGRPALPGSKRQEEQKRLIATRREVLGAKAANMSDEEIAKIKLGLGRPKMHKEEVVISNVEVLDEAQAEQIDELAEHTI